MYIGQDNVLECKNEMTLLYLSNSINICFRCSKEPSHKEGSIEYPQHMF